MIILDSLDTALFDDSYAIRFTQKQILDNYRNI